MHVVLRAPWKPCKFLLWNVRGSISRFKVCSQDCESAELELESVQKAPLAHAIDERGCNQSVPFQRSRNNATMPNGQIFVFDDPSDSDSLGSPPRKKQKQKQKQKRPKLIPVLYKASVKKLADTGTAKTAASATGIDNALLQRIKKCLQRANHENTPESEAKAAFYLASRLMGQHNVSQAEVLAHEPPATQQQYAGQSVVSIKRADDDAMKSVNNQGFVSQLASAMSIFFDCKSYSEQGYCLMEWTFYGIAENTVAAVMAFEMAYNLISEWARPYKGNASKNSYCIGVAEELLSMAKREKEAQEEQAQEAEIEALNVRVEEEQTQRRAELDRLAFQPSSVDETGEFLETPNADDETAPDFVESEFWVDPQADIDDEIKRLIKPEPRSTLSPSTKVSSSLSRTTPTTDSKKLPNQDATPKSPSTIKQEDDSEPDSTAVPIRETAPKFPAAIKQEDNSEPDSRPFWASSMQLTTFRANASRIADDYLKGHGVKLHASRSRSSRVSDWSAYLQGTRDSKKIDVRRNKIEE